MTEPGMSIVYREPVTAYYRAARDEVSAIRDAWQQLEDEVGSLRGLHFLGVFDPVNGWYRACVQTPPDGSLKGLSAPEMVVPGGRYARIRLRGEPPGVYDEIAPAYSLLASSSARDDSRPSIERYRRRDEIDVLMPLVDES